MFILILGLALWWSAHLWRRVAPGHRASFGNKGKVVVAGLLVLAVILMVWGYRVTDGPVWWGASAELKWINNPLVLVDLYLVASSILKTGITRRIRHPQLTGFSIWAVAHLLVNGDLPSFVLFGGLLTWAAAEIVIINRAQPNWTPPPPAPAWKEATAAVVAVLAFGLIGMIHIWLGYYPFGF